jgi:nicotinate-nucleotide adenylyltransferase
MRIGIFGGSFDPIHQGHLILAENCRDQASLDQVLFIPCKTNPLKSEGPASTDRQRCEMVELAIAGHESFRLSKIELEREGSSFTVDTLAALSESHPNDELFLLMGDDSLESFDLWKDPARICELATPLVANRPGSGEVDLSVLEKHCSGDRYREACATTVESPMIEISSSVIRDRLASKTSVRYLLPRAVQRYIESQSVYS